MDALGMDDMHVSLALGPVCRASLRCARDENSAAVTRPRRKKPTDELRRGPPPLAKREWRTRTVHELRPATGAAAVETPACLLHQASTTRRSTAASSLKKEIAMTALNTLIIAALAAAALAPAAHAQQAAGDLILTFPTLATHQGQVMIVVYDSAEAWKGGKPVRATMASAADAAPSAKIIGLPPGTYAAKVFQDVDGDGKMGLNPFGLPTEPYGFSNGALPNMGPPSFEAAAFDVKPGANAQSIQLK
jgi:uncharacterized protein (DUF2141 family)